MIQPMSDEQRLHHITEYLNKKHNCSLSDNHRTTVLQYIVKIDHRGDDLMSKQTIDYLWNNGAYISIIDDENTPIFYLHMNKNVRNQFMYLIGVILVFVGILVQGVALIKMVQL